MSIPTQSPAATLYSQLDNDQGTAWTSQNFEAANDAFDNSGADSFTVPAATVWKVQAVVAAGVYYNGAGPAASETVTFYRDKGGKPGKVLTAVTATGGDSGGTFTIPVGAVRLPAGNYWVGVVANMDFAAGGQWGWEGRSVASGSAAQWRNPGNGFATGCVNWGALGTCIPGAGPDLMFALNGIVKVA